MQSKRKVFSLKGLFTQTLSLLLIFMFISTLFISISTTEASLNRNLNKMVEAEFNYLKLLIDREALSPQVLTDYTVLADKNSFVLIFKDGAVIGSTHLEDLSKSPEAFNLDLPSILNQEDPNWVHLNGKAYSGYAKEYRDMTIFIAVSSSNIINFTSLSVFSLTFSYLVFYFILFFTVSRLLKKTVIYGINSTNASLAKITSGDLEEKVDVCVTKEFVSLSEGINETVISLKDAIKRAKTTAWMERELSVASDIQLSAMPKLSHALKDDKRIDLYASIKTAREVGGDFYDYFVLDEDRIGIVIADVSGKGIPAAMFMMTAKTHIRLHMEQGKSLSEAFDTINQELCENNDAEMFVTVFAGILNIQTGQLKYINAGHNPSLLLGNTDDVWLRKKSGPLVGLLENVHYTELSVLLEKDTLLFLYTDGITEAENLNRKFFGEAAMASALKASAHLPLNQISQNLHDAIEHFSAGAEQSDDITMLLVRRSSK